MRRGHRNRSSPPKGNSKITQFFTTLIPRKKDEKDELLNDILRKPSLIDSSSSSSPSTHAVVPDTPPLAPLPKIPPTRDTSSYPKSPLQSSRSAPTPFRTHIGDTSPDISSSSSKSAIPHRIQSKPHVLRTICKPRTSPEKVKPHPKQERLFSDDSVHSKDSLHLDEMTHENDILRLQVHVSTRSSASTSFVSDTKKSITNVEMKQHQQMMMVSSDPLMTPRVASRLATEDVMLSSNQPTPVPIKTPAAGASPSTMIPTHQEIKMDDTMSTPDHQGRTWTHSSFVSTEEKEAITSPPLESDFHSISASIRSHTLRQQKNEGMRTSAGSTDGPAQPMSDIDGTPSSPVQIRLTEERTTHSKKLRTSPERKTLLAWKPTSLATSSPLPAYSIDDLKRGRDPVGRVMKQDIDIVSVPSSPLPVPAQTETQKISVSPQQAPASSSSSTTNLKALCSTEDSDDDDIIMTTPIPVQIQSRPAKEISTSSSLSVTASTFVQQAPQSSSSFTTNLNALSPTEDSDDDDIIMTTVCPDKATNKILDSQKEFDFSMDIPSPEQSATEASSSSSSTRALRSRRSLGTNNTVASIRQSLASRQDAEDLLKQKQIRSRFKDLESLLRKNEKQVQRLDTMAQVFSESDQMSLKDEKGTRQNGLVTSSDGHILSEGGGDPPLFSDASRSMVFNQLAAADEQGAGLMQSLLDESSSHQSILEFVNVFQDDRRVPLDSFQFVLSKVEESQRQHLSEQEKAFLNRLELACQPPSTTTSRIVDDQVPSRPSKRRRRETTSQSSSPVDDPQEKEEEDQYESDAHVQSLLKRVFFSNMILSWAQLRSCPIPDDAFHWLVSLVVGAQNHEIVEEAMCVIQQLLNPENPQPLVHINTVLPLDLIQSYLVQLGMYPHLSSSKTTLSQLVTRQLISPDDDKKKKLEDSLHSMDRIHLFLQILRDVLRVSTSLVSSHRETNTFLDSESKRRSLVSLLTRMGMDSRIRVVAKRTLSDCLDSVVSHLEESNWRQEVLIYIQDMKTFLIEGDTAKSHQIRFWACQMVSLWHTNSSRMIWICQHFSTQILSIRDDDDDDKIVSSSPVDNTLLPSQQQDQGDITFDTVYHVMTRLNPYLNEKDHGREGTDYECIRDSACLLWYALMGLCPKTLTEKTCLKNMSSLLRKVYASIPDSRSIFLERVQAKHELFELTSAMIMIANRYKQQQDSNNRFTLFFK